MTEIAILAPLPTISRALTDALTPDRQAARFGPTETPDERASRMRRGEPAPGMVIRLQPVVPSVAVVAEAKRVLPQLERAMQPPAQGAQIAAAERMLEKLNASIASPLGSKALRVRACFLAEAAADLPAAAWDDSVDRKLLRKFRFMPSVAEVIEILEAEIQPMRDKIARVRIISQYEAPVPPTRHRPTPEEAEKVRAMVAKRRAEMEAANREEEEIRQFGSWMPPGAEGMNGLDLADALRAELPNLSGAKLRVTRDRISMLERNAAMAAEFEREGQLA